jgi:hypothetical protein
VVERLAGDGRHQLSLGDGKSQFGLDGLAADRHHRHGSLHLDRVLRPRVDVPGAQPVEEQGLGGETVAPPVPPLVAVVVALPEPDPVLGHHLHRI